MMCQNYDKTSPDISQDVCVNIANKKHRCWRGLGNLEPLRCWGCEAVQLLWETV